MSDHPGDDVRPTTEQPEQPEQPEQLTVAVDDEHLGSISDVVAELESRGMLVDQVLGAAGVILGSARAADRGGLAAVTGVVSVEGESTVQLPPPDSPVQ